MPRQHTLVITFANGSVALLIPIDMNVRLILLTAVIALNVAAHAQSSSAALAARQWRELHQAGILEQFMNLLSIPNVASDCENIQGNADLLTSMLQKRGSRLVFSDWTVRIRSCSAKSELPMRSTRSSSTLTMTVSL